MFFHNNVATLVLSIVFTSSMFCLCCCLSLQHDEITTIRIGSRPSKLATIQAKAVASHLQSHHPNIKPILVPIQASGDIVDPSSTSTSTSSSTSLPPVIQDIPLAFSNVDFTRTLDDAVLEGKIDIAVHSLKDIPPDHRWKTSQKLKIYCPLPREDSHDVLIGPYKMIQELPDGAKVGTSSIRRQAQLLYQCSKQKNHQNNDMQVEVVNLRGNVETRLSALTNGDVDALILARSGLHRLQMLLSTSDDGENNNESNKNIIQCNTIPYNDMLPGTCQGIVAAVVLKGGKFDNNDDDDENYEGFFCWNNNCIINEESTLMAYAERQFLNILDLATPWKGRPPLAGILEKCSKEEEIEDTTTTYWKFQGLLASTDGKQVISSEKTSMELQQQQQCGEVSIFTKEMAISLGEQVARDILEQAGPHFFDDDGLIKRK